MSAPAESDLHPIVIGLLTVGKFRSNREEADAWSQALNPALHVAAGVGAVKRSDKKVRFEVGPMRYGAAVIFERACVSATKAMPEINAAILRESGDGGQFLTITLTFMGEMPR